MYQRILESQINFWLESGRDKVVILYGARQVGKTTLARAVAEKFDKDYYYVDCQDVSNQKFLNSRSVEALKNFIGDKKLVLLDEGQEVEYIGVALKLIHDHLPQVKVIATGSSSFELANKLSTALH